MRSANGASRYSLALVLLSIAATLRRTPHLIRLPIIFLGFYGDPASSLRAQPSHTIESVGSFPTFDAFCVVTDVNEHGHTVGYFGAAGGSTRGFLNQDGTLTDLGPSSPNGLNDNGQIVGLLSGAPTLWTNGVPSTLQGTGSPTAINNSGLIAGVAQINGTGSVACLWHAGTMQVLGAPSGKTNSVATGVNENGEVTGYAFNGSPINRMPFIWRPATGFTNLGLPPGASEAMPSDINDRTQLVLTVNPENRAFIWDPISGFQDTGFPHSGGTPGLNDFGSVVGSRSWFTRGITGTLSNLVAPDSGWSLIDGRDVNNAGVIVGTGRFSEKTWGYIMRPTVSPEARLQIFLGTELQISAPDPTKVYLLQDSVEGGTWTTRETIPGSLEPIQRFRAHDDPAKMWRVIEDQ